MTGLVSIIIPTYNRAELLKQTLESVMSQDYTNFEVIVVDDGSENDETRLLCDGYDKVKYHRIENSGGPAKPRNEGIRMAMGEYVAFLDDDDLWVTEKLSGQLKVFESHPEVALVHSCCRLISKDGFRLDQIIGRPGSADEKSGIVYMRMIGNWTLMTSTVIMRRSLVDAVGYFNEKMPAAGEDLEYWCRCALRASFYYMDEPLVLYRQHTGASEKNRRKYIEVPGYLFKVVQQAYSDNLIDKDEFRRLRKQLVQMQIKKFNLGRLSTFSRLMHLNPFWFLNFENIKLLAAVVFRKT